MNNGKHWPIIVFGILAVILGAAVFRQFDFETLRFKKVGLGIVYLITFIGVVIFLVKNLRVKG